MTCKHRNFVEIGWDVFIDDSRRVISERQFRCDDCGELFFRDDDAVQNTLDHGHMGAFNKIAGICVRCGMVWENQEADLWSYHDSIGLFCNEHEDLMSEWNNLWRKTFAE